MLCRSWAMHVSCEVGQRALLVAGGATVDAGGPVALAWHFRRMLRNRA